MSVEACGPSQPITTGVVVFDPVAFAANYPQFATVPASALANNFTRATLQLNNCCKSVVKDANVRDVLLGLLVAHITALSNGENGQPPAGVVGRVAQAAEGSVNVSAEMSSNISQQQAYYIQTKYGAEFWAATAVYRTARYVPGHRHRMYGDFGQNYFGPRPPGIF